MMRFLGFLTSFLPAGSSMIVWAAAVVIPWILYIGAKNAADMARLQKSTAILEATLERQRAEKAEQVAKSNAETIRAMEAREKKLVADLDRLHKTISTIDDKYKAISDAEKRRRPGRAPARNLDIDDIVGELRRARAATTGNR
jgi:uncharacterized membrane protein YccC